MYGQPFRTSRLPKLAVTDFRGAGGSAAFMPVFNQTVYSDLQKSGMLAMVPKSLLPHHQPQTPADFETRAMREWESAGASLVAFGYAAEQSGTFVLYGYLFDLRPSTAPTAQLLSKRYFQSMNDDGARRTANNFAKDILVSIYSPSPSDPTNPIVELLQ
jgi:hypothetical protein